MVAAPVLQDDSMRWCANHYILADPGVTCTLLVLVKGLYSVYEVLQSTSGMQVLVPGIGTNGTLQQDHEEQDVTGCWEVGQDEVRWCQVEA